ncbi:50S ribosomal protein L23 [Candidatus Gottesmanbacteria bacterium RIFOXYB1_FULL_47_11]|uniref:Large ribosomal subunit protein uL23 n=1 Tax=Candidatus Gottesmanbacteria bacterium RIFOXYB1_FULL_47_11 TaxID=1798401 RepID=A0A1F6BEI6_9BACT|nr:MAG: 50S ribosomal protein L23 [Candidatus Gottesmanbacteria bacterium RIFOXYB1_FULL_47_11]
MIIGRPIITEKSMGLASRGWYTFAVLKSARKEAIAREIERTYHVDVVTVRTIAMHGKVRRVGKKMVSGHKSDWKKAIALLKPGQHIDAFEVTTKEEPVKETQEAQEVKKPVVAKSKSKAKAKAKVGK